MDSSQGRLQITLLKELSGGTFARVYLAEATGLNCSALGSHGLAIRFVLDAQFRGSMEELNLSAAFCPFDSVRELPSTEDIMAIFEGRPHYHDAKTISRANRKSLSYH